MLARSALRSKLRKAASMVLAAMCSVLLFNADANAQVSTNKFKYMDWGVTCNPTWCSGTYGREFDTVAEGLRYAWSSYTRKDGYEVLNYYPGYDYVCGPANPVESATPTNPWGLEWVVTVEFNHAWCRWRNRATGQLEDNASKGNGYESVRSRCEPGTSMRNMPDGYAYCQPDPNCLANGPCRLKQFDGPRACTVGNPTLPATGCARRSKSEPPCRPNIEPGVEADGEAVGCG